MSKVFPNPDEELDYVSYSIAREDNYLLHATQKEAAQSLIEEDWANGSYPRGNVCYIYRYDRQVNAWYTEYALMAYNNGHVDNDDLRTLIALANN